MPGGNGGCRDKMFLEGWSVWFLNITKLATLLVTELMGRFATFFTILFSLTFSLFLS